MFSGTVVPKSATGRPLWLIATATSSHTFQYAAYLSVAAAGTRPQSVSDSRHTTSPSVGARACQTVDFPTPLGPVITNSGRWRNARRDPQCGQITSARAVSTPGAGVQRPHDGQM